MYNYTDLNSIHSRDSKDNVQLPSHNERGQPDCSGWSRAVGVRTIYNRLVSWLPSRKHRKQG